MLNNRYGEVDYKDFARKEKIKKQDKSVSCVYELLNEGQSCKWMNDGTIVLNRPASSSLLNKIKFRSFSANIRNDITNTTIPDISFDLCARFIHLNTSGAVYRKLKGTPSEQTKLYIGNGSGEYVFEGGNGIYDNDINGNIVIETDKINIANGLDEAYNSAVSYSNKQIKSLLGFHLREENEDYYQYNSFTSLLQTVYGYLSGVNGLCVGFNESTQNPVWLNTITFEKEERTVKDYYNLLGHPKILAIEEEGDKTSNNYKVNSITTTDEIIDIASNMPANMTIIDIGACAHRDDSTIFVLFTQGEFKSFEERRKYNPKYNYYIFTLDSKGVKTSIYNMKTLFQTLADDSTSDYYIPPLFYDYWFYNDVKYYGFNCYFIGKVPTAKFLCFRVSTNATSYSYFKNEGYYMAGDITKYPYYGSDYWWLFLCQHFYGFYNSAGDSPFMSLPFKDPTGGNYWSQTFKLTSFNGDFDEEYLINNYTTSNTPLIFMFDPSNNADKVYSCRYCREASDKLSYSYNLNSNIASILDIGNYSNIDYVGDKVYNVEYIEFGDENTLGFQYSNYVFDGNYYYKYQYWAPNYTLSDSRIYYSAGGVLFEPYTPIIISQLGDQWINPTHTDDYNYRLIYSEGLSNKYFTYDKDNQTINSIRIPVWNQGTKDYGIIEFYLRFYTSPISYFIDPTIKILPYLMLDYYKCSDQENYINGVIVKNYNLSDITKIIDETYYNKMLLFMELSNSDQTLKLVCDNYPTLNNIVFYLNETSMIDFKEADSNPAEPNIKCKIIDANDVVITPINAKNLYSNITICLDWEFNN